MRNLKNDHALAGKMPAFHAVEHLFRPLRRLCSVRIMAVAGSLGMPVSTTHAITTSIMGVGCAKRFSALKLGLIERIVWAWVLTIPATAGVAFAVVWLANAVGFIGFAAH